MGLLVHSKKKYKIKGDKSLSKRDFLRVIKPLKNLEQNLKLIMENFQLKFKEQIIQNQ